PHATRALHMARDGAAGRLDFSRRDPLGLHRLQTKGAEIERRACFRSAVDAALVLLSEFCACGLKHDNCPSMRGGLVAASATGAIGIRSFNLPALCRHRIVLHDLALEYPDLYAA